MRIFIKNYVKGCRICQQFKINWNPSNPSYNPIVGPTMTQPFANCSMDLITNLPQIILPNGTIVNAILSVVDHGLMKGVVLTLCAKTLTEEGATEILLNHVYKRFRLPNTIISDRDPRFTTKSFQELLKLLGVKSKLTTVYHPQSDGTMEHFNQEIDAYIGIYCSSNPETWHKSIGTMEFTHNDCRHSDWQWTAFELMLGSSPVAIPTPFQEHQIPFCWKQTPTTPKRLTRSTGSTWTHSKKNDRMTEEQIHQIQTRTTSLAWHTKHQNLIPQENGPKMRRTIQDQRSPRTINVSLPTSFDMENSRCLPCGAPYALHGNQNSQTQLPPATPWYWKQWRTMGNWNHS